MESNWRLNVWETGLASDYIRLAAYLHGYEPGIVMALDERRPDSISEYVLISDDWGYRYAGSVPPRPGHPHFPFGYDVTPDQPT